MSQTERPRSKRPTPLATHPVTSQEVAPTNDPGSELVALNGSYESDPNAIGALSLSIPGAPRPPRRILSRSMIHIYGDPKIGKTTFAAQAPGAWFIATEQGQDWVTVREPTLVHSWEQFLEFCSFVQETKPTKFADGTPIETFVLDRIEGLFKMCEEWARASLGVEDLGELGHGKGWSRLTGEFERVMNKVRRWPFGLIAISHARQKEFKTRSTKVDRWEPDIGSAGARWCAGQADLILHAHSLETDEANAKGEPTGRIIEQRVVRCHPAARAVAGGRMADCLPEIMLLDYHAIRRMIEHPETAQ